VKCIEGCQCSIGRVLCQNRVSTNGGSKMFVQALSIGKELALELNESVHVWLICWSKTFFFSGYKIDWNNGPGASIKKGSVLKDEELVRSLLLS